MIKRRENHGREKGDCGASVSVRNLCGRDPTCTHLCVMAVDSAREAGLQYSASYNHLLQAN